MTANEDPLILFFALLAVLCQVFVVATAVLGVAGALAPAARVRRRSVTRALQPVCAPFAFCIATVTMLGSLYLSEVKHFIPCHLCWVQRAFLYPQVVLMAILSLRPQLAWPRRTALLLVISDIPISLYHYALQQNYFDLQGTSQCDPANPCTQQYFLKFGYISEPFMALSAASAILALLLLHRSLTARELLIGLLTAVVSFVVVVPLDGSAVFILPIVLMALGIFHLLDRRSAEREAATGNNSVPQ